MCSRVSLISTGTRTDICHTRLQLGHTLGLANSATSQINFSISYSLTLSSFLSLSPFTLSLPPSCRLSLFSPLFAPPLMDFCSSTCPFLPCSVVYPRRNPELFLSFCCVWNTSSECPDIIALPFISQSVSDKQQWIFLSRAVLQQLAAMLSEAGDEPICEWC